MSSSTGDNNSKYALFSGLVVVIAVAVFMLSSGTAISSSKNVPFNRAIAVDISHVDSYPSHLLHNIRPVRAISQWGAYRPDIYFGLKSTTDAPLVTGIMWKSGDSKNKYRHEPSGDADAFYWTRNNGNNFGEQYIKDSDKYGMDLDMSFFVNSNKKSLDGSEKEYDFAQRIAVIRSGKGALADKEKELILYFGIECSEIKSRNACIRKGFEFYGVYEDQGSIAGKSKQNYRVLNVVSRSKVRDEEWNSDIVIILDTELSSSTCNDKERECMALSWASIGEVDSWGGANRILSDSEKAPKSLSQKRTDESEVIFKSTGMLDGKIAEFSSFAAVQVRNPRSFEAHSFHYSNIIGDTIESVISQMETITSTIDSAANLPRLVTDLQQILKAERLKFDDKFDKYFPINSDKYSEKDANVARLALSSVLGGIGYFQGVPLIGNAIDVDQETSLTDSTNRLDTSSVPAKVSVTLFSGTPSRTAFPRGFLWDEGFHQMLVSSLDVDLSMNVISSWLNAMYAISFSSSSTGGWIPREMILGEAARKRVPEEFLTQRVNVANPPTMMLVIERLINRIISSEKTCQEKEKGVINKVDSCAGVEVENKRIFSFLKQAFPALESWMRWYEVTQAGPIDGTYRWRGRSSTDRKFIPNTLASGLDDFPRSPFVSTLEQHLDLHCWMTKSNMVMSKLQNMLSNQEIVAIYGDVATSSSSSSNGASYFNYTARFEFLNEKLNEVHWSPNLLGFFDVGLHHEHLIFEKKILFRCENPKDKSTGDYPISPGLIKRAQMAQQNGEVPPQVCPDRHPKPLYPMGDGSGGYIYHEAVIVHPDYIPVVKNDNDNDDGSGMHSLLKVSHIPRTGYVNIFPLLLRLIAPKDSVKLFAMLDILSKPDYLYSKFGLRSISKKDSYYRRKNAPGDEPYWRGPIWININYLALGSLKYYSENLLVEEKVRSRCLALYNDLHSGVSRNILDNFHKTGHLWEQYDDANGGGIRGKPFTGWTALVASIMAEKYN